MAQTQNTVLYSSAAVQLKESVLPGMLECAQVETPFLDLIGFNHPPVINPTHQWAELVWTPERTTLGTTINSSDTTIVFSTKCTAGEHVIIGTELILVGTDAGAGTTFTSCTRSVGGQSPGDAAAHTAGDMVIRLGVPRVQGATASTSLKEEPANITNYTRIFTEYINVPKTMAALDQWYRPNVSRYDFEKNQIMVNLLHQLQHAALYSKYVAPSTNATAGNFDGLLEHVMGTNSTDLSSDDVSIDDLEDGMQTIQNKGGSPTHLICGLRQSRVINAMGIAREAVAPGAPGSNIYGGFIDTLKLGGKLVGKIVLPAMDTHLVLFDASKSRLRPLVNREFTHSYYGETGDSILGNITGEYTMENGPAEGSMVFYGAKVSA